MDTYEPELGQAIFGQPHQTYEVPDIMEAVLTMVRLEYERVYWNAKQKDCFSPFGNHGTRLNTSTFKAHAYSWGDDEQPFNFEWRDVRVSWYKWMGRGMSSNILITPEMASKCLDECLAEIRKMEEGETESGEYPNFIDLD